MSDRETVPARRSESAAGEAIEKSVTRRPGRTMSARRGGIGPGSGNVSGVLRLVVSVLLLGLLSVTAHADTDTDTDTEGDLRIEGGSSDSRGRLEIFHDGVWGGVCDDDFGHVDAGVACRQLGYATGVASSDFFPLPSERAFWLDNLGCTGTESQLSDCPHRGWGTHDCGVIEAATVSCTGFELTGFVLVDASTNADLGPVANGGTVSVSQGGSYGVRAEVSSDFGVGSVVLSLEGPDAGDEHTQTENIVPWSLYGDRGDGAGGRALNGRALAAGSYTLTATAYAARRGSGDVLDTLTVSFTVEVDTQVSSTPPSPSPGGCSHGDLPESTFWSACVTLGSERAEGSWSARWGYVDVGDGWTVGALSDASFTYEGETYMIDELLAYARAKPPILPGRLLLSFDGYPSNDTDTSNWVLRIGGEDFRFSDATDDEEDFFGNRYWVSAPSWDRSSVGDVVAVSLRKAVRTSPSAEVLTGFTLVDVSDQSTVATLSDGAEVDLGAGFAGSFGIRAEVDEDAEVGSVALSLSGATAVSRTENIAPYSLWGDVNRGSGSALHGAALAAGSYTLTATAYSKRRAEGDVLGTLTVSFDIISAPALSVADASAEEGTDATLDFEVTLDREAAHTVTVAYATANGTATAGSDYTATSGTLTFAAGDTEKTVSVPVLADDTDEGSEALTLTLTSPTGATIVDGEATGTITNDGPIPEAWLARFGRTVTGQVLDAVESRLNAPRQAGAQASLAGQALASGRGGDAGGVDPAAMFGAGDAAAREPESRALTGRDFVTGTSFTLTGGSSEGGGFAALWGRGSVAGFDGREGSLAVDGEVTTGLIGADFASERWTAGLALGHSTGTGGWRRGGACDPNCAGSIDATLSGLYPYAGVALTDRLSVWAAAGYGAGEVTVTPEGEAGLSADLTMEMGAAGARSEVLRPEDGSGLSLALKGDARFTRTSSDAVRGEAGNLAAADADVWLVRTGVEGARPFRLGGNGAALTPSFEVGVRLDGGDAETGMGADLGGGIAFADPGSGLAFDMKARGLVAHESAGFREWGASLAASWDPRPATDRGLALTLTQSWGASPAGGMDALLDRETLVGLAGGDDRAGTEAASRLEAELGYGLPVFGGAFTGTPHAGVALTDSGREYRLGWRLTAARRDALGFALDLEGTRGESAGGDESPEHAVMLRGSMRW